jgi:Rps23 Pro-64 3,4-dihydroxylase Tpa1-like proline 4-hydroxylase
LARCAGAKPGKEYLMQDIELDVTLTDGKTYSSILPSDSPLLHDLFVSLASAHQHDPQRPALLLQLPLDDGRAACSFMSTSVLSLVTRPPVLISHSADQAVALPAPVSTVAPLHVCIDDFLTPGENAELLSYALDNEAHFQGSAVIADDGKDTKDSKHRKSRVLFDIKDSKWRDVFVNRLALHLPHLLRGLGLQGFTPDDTEIQLTASNDGDFFKRHADADHRHQRTASRVVTFVYYLNRTPRPYSGGNLLLYGHSGSPGVETGSNVKAVEPVNNMLVVFPSDLLHEVDIVQSSGGAFRDSRFTVNGWLRRAE